MRVPTERQYRLLRILGAGDAGIAWRKRDTEQLLRRWAVAEGFDIDRILWDLRNCLSLCERHHAAHHSWARRLTLSFVLEHCPKLHQFASELGLMWWLEREYPETAGATR